MENKPFLSSDSLLVVSTVIQGTKTTIDEIQEQKNSHSFELNLIRRRLTIIERNMVRQSDLLKVENAVKLELDNFKTFIRENVAMKSDVDSISRKTIDWVNENTATKADILKSENTLFWKIAGFIAVIVAATAYIIKA